MAAFAPEIGHKEKGEGRMACIKEVAARAGVSISTVSNVLNKTKAVSPELTRRVMIAVEELNYRADPVAQNMKMRQSRTIGVITTDSSGLFYPYVIKGLYSVFSKSHYDIIIIDSNGMIDQFGSIQRVLDGFEHLISSRVDGIVFSSMFPEAVEESSVRQIQRTMNVAKDIPIVSAELDFTKYGIDSVYADPIEGAVMATRHLIESGCRRLTHITGPISTRVAQSRRKGFQMTVEAAGLPFDSMKMIANGDYTHQSGYKAMRELIEQMPDLDGVFVANDQMAVGALRLLKERGLRVPEDVKVIGYDDVFVCGVVDPPLSTIHIQKHEMGVRAAQMLLDRIQGRVTGDPVSVRLEARLVVRKSTRPDAVDDWILVDW